MGIMAGGYLITGNFGYLVDVSYERNIARDYKN